MTTITTDLCLISTFNDNDGGFGDTVILFNASMVLGNKSFPSMSNNKYILCMYISIYKGKILDLKL